MRPARRMQIVMRNRMRPARGANIMPYRTPIFTLCWALVPKDSTESREGAREREREREKERERERHMYIYIYM